jgi:hypothetical protein
MRRIILSIAVLSVFQLSTADACQLTIPQLIELRRPEPVELYRSVELVSIPFEQVLGKAELIVEGSVRPLNTYLSEDKCHLYTDFEVVAPLVISGNLPPRAIPGPQPSVIVTQFGGTMIIDGVKVTVEDQQLRPFVAGQRVVLLLSRSGSAGRYEIAGDAFGAFIAEADGKVRPFLHEKGVYDDMRGLTKAQFVERVRRAGR